MYKFYSFLLLFSTLILGNAYFSKAQCDAACSPGNATENTISFLQSGFGTVVVGGSTNTFSPGRAVAGYVNSFCSTDVQVFRGATLRVSATVGPNINERVNVYIDLNNDNSIDPTSELVLSLTGRNTLVGFINIPSTIPVNTKIRMRFVSDRATATVGPCITPAIGQGFDIGITPRVNPNPPIANFTADSITCNRTVSFEDLSTNAPSTYLWDFGDGNSSTLPNPTHTYAANGVYSVSLRVENENGNDTLRRINFLRINDTTAIPASCQPIVANPCCGYRIANLTLANINTTSYPATGVNDLACRFKANLLVNTNYVIRFTGSPTAAQDSKLYIDLNNDGDFNETTELIAYVRNQTSPLINFRLPANTPVNIPIRARLLTDFVNSSFTACNDLTHGASLDFTILPKAVTVAPIAQFQRLSGDACSGNHTFLFNGPFPADTLTWLFGDGNTRTVLGNDTVRHTYNTLGNFNVTLIAANVFGRDTITINNIATFSQTPVDLFCEPRAFNLNPNDGITRVRLGTFDLTSLLSVAEGFYVDRACTSPIFVTLGTGNPTITLNYPINRNSTLRVWIDWNRDGNIAANELMVDLRNQNAGQSAALINLPTGILQNTPYRMRIIQAVAAVPNFCSNITTGQCEDYSLVFVPQPRAPIARIGDINLITCSNSVQLFDSSLNSPANWRWELIGVGISSNRNPVFSNIPPGTYSLRLIVGNALGSDTIERANAVTVVNPNGLVPATCTPNFFLRSENMGITQVSFLATNVSSNTTENNYIDNACRFINNTTRGATFNLNITQNSNNFGFITAFVDWNGNGTFETSESIIAPVSDGSVNRTITVPSTARTGRIRMRIVVYDSPLSTACDNGTFGEAEDYSLDIAAPTDPPVADFNFSVVNCGRIVSFTDNSTNSPTNYLWTFPNGDTSTAINPSYTFANPGVYPVTLRVSNNIGTNSITRNITINGLASISLPECEPRTLNASSSFPFGINRVRFGTLDYSSPLAWEEGYINRTCTDSARLRVDEAHAIIINTSNTDTEIVDVWLDINGDGFLTPSEKLFQSAALINHTFSYTAPSNIIKNRPLRLRVRSDIFQGNINISSCDDSFFGQVEDYTLIFTEPDATKAPKVQNITVQPNPVRNKLNIRLPDTHLLQSVKVIDITGKLLKQRAINATQTELDVEMNNLHPGLYFLQFEGINAPSNIRIIKE